jgi:predicted dehydrogenase
MAPGKACSNGLKVGLIGAGNISRAHVPGYVAAPDQVRLTAVYDTNPEAAARAATAAGGEATVYADLAQMLATAPIDAVDICTPHDQHARLAIAAAQAGKHVLLEKPMATSMADCRAILEACETAGVTFMVAQNLRHVPSYQGVKALVDGGRLGPVWSGVIEEFLAHGAARRPGESRSWYSDGLVAGGGVFITQSTHHIDLFRYFFGEIDRVSAATWTNHPGYAHSAEDSAVATLVFRNGLNVQLRASNSARIERMFFQIVGEDGVVFTQAPEGANSGEKHRAPAYASLRDQGPVAFAAGVGAQIPPAVLAQPPRPLPSDNPFTNEILHFAQCCLEGTEPLSSGRDNLETMKAVFGLYESARTGGAWVRLADM